MDNGLGIVWGGYKHDRRIMNNFEIFQEKSIRILGHDKPSQDEAKEHELAFFWNGVECKNGHLDYRRLTNRTCCQCVRDANRLRHISNPNKAVYIPRKISRNTETLDNVKDLALEKYASMMGRVGKDSYRDVIVDDRWLGSKGKENFVEWMVSEWQKGFYHKGYELDKDIVGNGRIYSPDHCCLVPQKINSFFSKVNLNDPTKLAKNMKEDSYGFWSFKWGGKLITCCEYEIDTYEEYLNLRQKVLFKLLEEHKGRINPKAEARARGWYREEYEKFISIRVEEFFRDNYLKNI